MAEYHDFSTYPEGFDRVVSLCDFLPDDYDTRAAFVEGLIGFVISL
ncbi:MAG: hypothetical protein IJI56_01885 [Firmicutes bacterium]|jgi:hypothetical protein|nr:hypothetical protein [Bacillota bacterium]